MGVIRYWRGTTNASWDTATNWNTASDGSGTSGLPQNGDDVNLDSTASYGLSSWPGEPVTIRNYTDANSNGNFSTYSSTLTITGNAEFGYGGGTTINGAIFDSTSSPDFHGVTLYGGLFKAGCRASFDASALAGNAVEFEPGSVLHLYSNDFTIYGGIYRGIIELPAGLGPYTLGGGYNGPFFDGCLIVANDNDVYASNCIFNNATIVFNGTGLYYDSGGNIGAPSVIGGTLGPSDQFTNLLSSSNYYTQWVNLFNNLCVDVGAFNNMNFLPGYIGDPTVQSNSSNPSLYDLASFLNAVLDKTKNLPSSPAAVGSAMTLTTGERTSIGTAVWATTARSLTTFGTLAADAASAVWAATTRTLTAFGFTPNVGNPGLTSAQQTELDAIKTKTDNLPTSFPSVDGSGKVALSTTGQAALIAALEDETFFKVIHAYAAGNYTADQVNKKITFYDLGGSGVVMTQTFDEDGSNRVIARTIS